MFDQLGEKLQRLTKTLQGRARITEDNIQQSLREIRIALLEADVAVPVVKDFIDDIRKQALGTEVQKNLRPGQVVVKIVQDELTRVLGSNNVELQLQAVPPISIMVAGLQGAGKTTSLGKLGRWLKNKKNKRVLCVSTDIRRPAAIDQLERLALDSELIFHRSTEADPVEIAREAVSQARQVGAEVLLIDTAGRLHVDNEMMDEVVQIHRVLKPVETLFVVDSMTGQDAANSAKSFDDALPLTGIILTKTDGDARGGAALSMRKITGKPIKFIGTGEKADALEVFHPERISSRLLGMGDIVSLVEQVEQSVDQEKAAKLAKKITTKRGFDLEDFRDQLLELKKMGGVENLLDKMPGMKRPATLQKMDNQNIIRLTAIVNSMTVKERVFPALIKGSRKQRIAKGSGTQVQDVNQLLRQFMQMQKMMKRMSGGKMQRMMAQMQNNPGGYMPFEK